MASEAEVRLKLKSDLEYYAAKCLKIRGKDKLQNFILNKAQLYIHDLLEKQLLETGRVRAIILKGRQQGCSTYAEARLMWKVTHTKGVRAFILTHEESASQTLFEMAKRYYDNLPDQIKPSISAVNSKELRFDKLDSGYRVGTAGNKSVGRSQTNQFFHGSEVAFWPNAAEHAKGILQTVPNSDNTEVIYESTANGVGNFFHEQWKAAESGESDFIAIFVPWFWQDEYRRVAPQDIELTQDEVDLKNYYLIDNDQIFWRRKKIIELSSGGMDGVKAFNQEYPMNSVEAFQVSGGDGLIKAEHVLKARNCEVTGSGQLIVGVDPSRGGDRFSIVKRLGRKAYDLRNWRGEEINKLGKAVSKCKAVLDEVCPIAGKKPDMMFIDAGGGADIADRLHELGYSKRVKAIYFGASPLDEKRYINKRGEMWGLMGQWLSDENLEVEIPDNDGLHGDLIASPYDRDSHDRMVLWRKEKIKKAYGYSPDDGDALALTWAEPVLQNDDFEMGHNSLW
tara:strand:+ start:163 stop:1686 length:1524 start_codon:yes stop_codon:yes gene_type:complete